MRVIVARSISLYTQCKSNPRAKRDGSVQAIV